MILIISHLEDEHALAVMEALEQRKQEYFLFDLAKYPKDYRLSIQYNLEQKNSFVLEVGNDKKIDLADVNVAWWRRPNGLTMHEELGTGAEINFAFNESYLAITGLWNALDCTWINEPALDDYAAKKVVQLKLAKELGFKIPETIITSSAEALRAFYEKQTDKVIYKSFAATQYAWRETRVLQEEDFEQIDDLKFAPVIFQSFIAAKSDLRITVIGDTILAGEVLSNTNKYAFDYRVEVGKSEVRPHVLPKEIESLIRAFMSRLNLKYGAIDMRLTPENEYVFLEINTSGQWKFIEKKSGLSITKTFVDYLVELNAMKRAVQKDVNYAQHILQ